MFTDCLNETIFLLTEQQKQIKESWEKEQCKYETVRQKLKKLPVSHLK